LVNMAEFYCYGNQLTVLPPEIGQLVNMTKFVCSRNQLTVLPPEIGQLVNMTEFDCSRNRLTVLPSEIGQLGNLTSLHYYNNPIEYIPPNLQRHLNRRLRNHQNLYDDKQSVHNSSIQASFRIALNNLMRDKVITNDSAYEDVINQITQDPGLTEKAKEQLVEYSENTDVHGELNVNFQEILCFVWNRISSSEDGNEIKKILSQEMDDADCMCFTGRITRLVNSLNGFFPDINIEINSTEQIGNIMEIIRSKLENENRYSVELFKDELSEALRERQYEQSVINEWLEYIE